MSTADDLTITPATLETIDRWLDYRVWHSRVPGAQVAVALDGEIVFSRAYGVADEPSGEPLTTEHLFHVASHSKTFTATLIMRLIEQDRLTLATPVGDHVAELSGHELGRITVQDLLEHTSGLLRDGLDADHWQHAHPFPDRGGLLRLVLDGGAKHGPGDLFAYSNLGYSLLGLIIESVTGDGFDAAVRDHLLEPLALGSTASHHRSDDEARYASGHSGLHVARRRSVLPGIDTAAMDAATGFTSTATDLVSWFSAHRLGSDQLLSDRAKRHMQRPLSPTDPPAGSPAGAEAYAYGWGLASETIGKRRMVGHGGGYPGHITRSLVDPVSGLAVSVLTNAIDGPASELVTGVIALIDDAAAHDDGEVPAGVEGWLGRYRNPWTVIDLAVVGDRLLALRPTAGEPLAGHCVLEVDGDRLRITEGNGFGSVGETVERTEDGIRFGGMSAQRWDDVRDAGGAEL